MPTRLDLSSGSPTVAMRPSITHRSPRPTRAWPSASAYPSGRHRRWRFCCLTPRRPSRSASPTPRGGWRLSRAGPCRSTRRRRERPVRCRLLADSQPAVRADLPVHLGRTETADDAGPRRTGPSRGDGSRRHPLAVGPHRRCADPWLTPLALPPANRRLHCPVGRRACSRVGRSGTQTAVLAHKIRRTGLSASCRRVGEGARRGAPRADPAS